jgi:hypothetical protein
MSTNPWVWIAALLTLAIFSFLYRENPFYRFAEHLVVGVANGYTITVAWFLILKPNLIDLIAKGQLTSELVLSVVGALIGILYFSRFFPNLSWLVRIPIAITLGYYSGYAIPRGMDASILRQAGGTLLGRSDFVQFPMFMAQAGHQLAHWRVDQALLSVLCRHHLHHDWIRRIVRLHRNGPHLPAHRAVPVPVPRLAGNHTLRTWARRALRLPSPFPWSA